ncbi:MAG: tRNA uridine-5-carboxymethylaminomethyl(34) synthesis GTPase MnmE [Chloroherpetonaceae bacterium]|nr:tRNA uridine-5-carboxymethylaminomethyl(34) synthesis GTPase MnmE [Chthonomonadaceae bacterium]MDW8207099.1 tRNA uridine-5-carboxymethylaminomethyl(34) synthesis GTPase MnmE [Chloroherpetonaceae bacterium]
MTTPLFPQDTIAAIATPPGQGGIAIIRVSGPGALDVAERVFRPGRGHVRHFRGYTLHYGTLIDPHDASTLDDGLLAIFRAPRSYTGEDMAELSCHGGQAVTARVLQAALDAGARLANPGEFTLRAFLNGRMDLAQAEAVCDLIRARTEASRRLARHQLEGHLSQALQHIREELIGILAAIEVTIDFSDEVGELDYTALETRIQRTRQHIEHLLATADRGRILREGLRVTLAGRPNVGKSSLLNALLRAERAIVTSVPGTTRDVIEESAQLNGILMVLTDTAGLRETDDVVERIGVHRTRETIARSDIILFVYDATAGWTAEDHATLNSILACQEAPEWLLIRNKCDLLPDPLPRAQPDPPALPARPLHHISVSARTGEGLSDLEQALCAYARTTSPDSVVIANARHQQALQQAHNSLTHALHTTQQQLPGDFIAIDVRGALDAVGQITGETVTEEIIHRIFQDFCVGK